MTDSLRITATLAAELPCGHSHQILAADEQQLADADKTIRQWAESHACRSDAA